ncbi:MAG TPA: efflux RND transporter periplasmic adaptor subunit [Deltaproteobacteria bacterium]|jgi:RND family efflux transporter MFP subunit|nr:efflux RND transporter periplasmic adaptor subunit [Deltaproteobacteria bacterium]HQH99869.1 efflux RND transporter periplasmic adaptor subunit [Deltaproteobacteria bacterium]
MSYHAVLKDKADRIPKDGTPLRRIKPFDWISLASLLAILAVSIYAGHFTREFMVDVSRVSQEYPYQEYTKLHASGTVVVEHRVSVSPRIAGQVAQIMVDKGSLVKKNQVIARLESTDEALLRDQRAADLRLAKARLEQAGILLSEAEADYERIRDQYKDGSASESELNASAAALRKAKSAFEVAQATVNAQSAALRSAQAAFDHIEVKAPFDGVVLSRDAHIGDMVGPRLSASGEGSGIVTLADLSSLEIEAEVPSSEIESIKTGQPCMIVLESPKVHLRAEVESIMPPGSKDKTAAGVRIRLIDRDVRILPETGVDVAFLDRQILKADDKPLLLIDRSSLIRSRGGHSVFVVRGDKAVEKRVRVGGQLGDKVRILQGVTDGDMIITNPPEGMRNGSKVLADKD